MTRQSGLKTYLAANADACYGQAIAACMSSGEASNDCQFVCGPLRLLHLVGVDRDVWCSSGALEVRAVCIVTLWRKFMPQKLSVIVVCPLWQIWQLWLPLAPADSLELGESESTFAYLKGKAHCQAPWLQL